MTRPSANQTYMEIAYAFSRRSTCPRRQVGCVLVDRHNRIIAHGYNGVPSGQPHCNEGHPCAGVGYPSGQGLDKCDAIHAEQNAILLLPDPWKVWKAYITTFPCSSCIKLLLGTSCQEIVCPLPYSHPEAQERWEEAGRTVTWFKADIST